jgi:hypothetical protein
MFLMVQGLITLTEGNWSFIFCFCCVIVYCVLLYSTLLILNCPPPENMAFSLTFTKYFGEYHWLVLFYMISSIHSHYYVNSGAVILLIMRT